jgi:hypothetical protein
MAFTIITQGKITQGSTATPQKVVLPSSADYFRVHNITQASAAAPSAGVVFEWYNGVTAQNAAIETYKSGSAALLQDDITTGGFTYVNSAPVIEAQNAAAITGITAASPAVVSQTSHGYSDGDILQFYGTTGMLQVSGMNFQISTVNANDYTLIGLRAAGFAAAATAGFTRRISKYAAVDPQFLYVTEITKASQAVVRVSVDPSAYYVVGMKLHFSVPYSFGMTQMNGLTGTIVAISSANYTMTVDIDSTAFSTFAFPTSASSPTSALFATVAPAGASTQFNPITNVQTGYNFQYQPFRTGQFTPYMYLPTGAHSPGGQANDVLVWQAYKMETGTIS